MTTTQQAAAIERELALILRVASDSEGAYEDLDRIARAAARARALLTSPETGGEPAHGDEIPIAA